MNTWYVSSFFISLISIFFIFNMQVLHILFHLHLILSFFLFREIINVIAVKILAFKCSLLVHRNIIHCSMFILYPVILMNLLISSRRFFCRCPGYFLCKQMRTILSLLVQHICLFFFLLLSFLFSFISSLHWLELTSLFLNKSDDGEHSFFPKAFCLSPSSIMSAVWIHIWSLSNWKSSISS